MGVYVIFRRREGGGVLRLGCDLWGMRYGEVNCCCCFFWEDGAKGGKWGRRGIRGKEGGERKKERKKDGGGDDGINDDEEEGRFGADWWGRLLRAWMAMGWGGKW